VSDGAGLLKGSGLLKGVVTEGAVLAPGNGGLWAVVIPPPGTAGIEELGGNNGVGFPELGNLGREGTASGAEVGGGST